MTDSLIIPDWPAPAAVRAASSTRLGGVSQPPYASFNLGYHAGDDPACVDANRKQLIKLLDLPGEPAWLQQVHGTTVVEAIAGTAPVVADAAYSSQRGTICVVLTADCLPVLLCDRAGTRVAAAHAGWRGLAGGVLARTVAAVQREPAELLAWLGPAIGPEVFEIGPEVRAAFLALDSENAICFRPSLAGSSPGRRWLADIYELARRQLRAAGVRALYGGGWCTLTERERFFSYRRDGARSGRMASLIWLQNPS